MDAKMHGKFTESTVKMSRKIDGAFSVFGDGLFGKNLEIIKDKKIVQAWACKLKEWPERHFSRVTFILKKAEGGTKLEFTQIGVPAACFRLISDGWKKFYWRPMKKMLEKK